MKIKIKHTSKPSRGIVKVINGVMFDNLGARMTKKVIVRFI
jgi:hypothetical protein